MPPTSTRRHVTPAESVTVAPRYHSHRARASQPRTCPEQCRSTTRQNIVHSSEILSRIVPDFILQHNMACTFQCERKYTCRTLAVDMNISSVLVNGAKLVKPLRDFKNATCFCQRVVQIQLLYLHMLHCALSCGAMYCNRSCLFVCVCLFLGLLPR